MLETQLEDLCEFYQVRVGFLWDLEKTLMRFQLVTHFYTPLKTSENYSFSSVFRGYRSGAVDDNLLKKVNTTLFIWEFLK